MPRNSIPSIRSLAERRAHELSVQCGSRREAELLYAGGVAREHGQDEHPGYSIRGLLGWGVPLLPTEPLLPRSVGGWDLIACSHDVWDLHLNNKLRFVREHIVHHPKSCIITAGGVWSFVARHPHQAQVLPHQRCPDSGAPRSAACLRPTGWRLLSKPASFSAQPLQALLLLHGRPGLCSYLLQLLLLLQSAVLNDFLDPKSYIA